MGLCPASVRRRTAGWADQGEIRLLSTTATSSGAEPIGTTGAVRALAPDSDLAVLAHSTHRLQPLTPST